MIFWAALRKELREQWRSYRLLIAGVVLLFFGLTSPLLTKYLPDIMELAMPEGPDVAALMPTPTAEAAVDQYVKNISQFGILLALLLAMGAVAQEKDKGTAALILVKPMPRWVFLGAKFLALGLTFAAGLLVAGAAGYYYTLLLFEAPDLTSWLALHGLMLLVLLVYVALTLFCSTLTTSQVVGGGLAFGILIVLAGVGAIPGVGTYLPNQLITWGSRLAIGVPETYWPAFWISLGLVATALIGAWAVFERQEL